ncbi:MAG: hypothetical protein LBG74_04190 [Spirochaetaceae bacterium]|jgi:hypothetical protein|nr:hypothetical protein [Spirochaetaceae bacterium]
MITFFTRPYRALAVFLLMAEIAVPVFSQPEDVITSIRITGLKRTKHHTAEEPLRRFAGQEASSIDADKVKAAIIDQGILEPLSVAIEEEASSKTLVVEVREKWTLFAIPIFFAGSNGISGGVAVFDANAFGLNHKIAASGMYQSEGWLAMAMYAALPGSPRHFGWGGSVFVSEGERRDSGPSNETLRRFNIRSIAARFSPQYQISNSLNAAFPVSYTNIALLDTASPRRAPDSGAQFVQFGPEFSVRSTSWDGYLLSEKSAQMEYHLVLEIDSRLWHSLSFKGIYEKAIVPGFRMSFRGGALYSPDVPPFLENGPSESGVNILPNSFSARHYAGLSLGLEKYICRFSFGTISILGAWQMVYSNGPILENRFDYGATGSLRFYMSRLAIPAVGLGIAYNIPEAYFQFSFSIGMAL